jgi:metal-responsive CopG/Arc/MetJ family transcriptional regulator
VVTFKDFKTLRLNITLPTRLLEEVDPISPAEFVSGRKI